MATTEYDNFERFTNADVPDDPTAEAVASRISEQFYDPTVTAVVAVFEDDVVEFDASDIGLIQAVDGRVHGMIRESPSADTIEEIRVRSKPWLTERFAEVLGVEAGDTLTLHYDSRFGNEVDKAITVEEVAVERADKPYGYEWDGIEGNVDVVAVFGFREGNDFGLMLQTNGGVNLLMNDTRIVEPGTIPTFEVNND